MPQPLSKIAIANLALKMNSQKPIVSLDQDAVEARVIKEYFDVARLAALREHDWKFARIRKELTAATGETVLGWAYVWDYPDDCHVVRKVFVDTTAPNPDPVEWAQYFGPVTGKQLICTNEVDANNKCYAQFTYTAEGADSVNIGVYDPLFALAFAAMLAYLTAKPLTGKQGDFATFETILNRAKLADAREQRVLSTRKNESEFLSVRG